MAKVEYENDEVKIMADHCPEARSEYYWQEKKDWGEQSKLFYSEAAAMFDYVLHKLNKYKGQ